MKNTNQILPKSFQYALITGIWAVVALFVLSIFIMGWEKLNHINNQNALRNQALEITKINSKPDTNLLKILLQKDTFKQIELDKAVKTLDDKWKESIEIRDKSIDLFTAALESDISTLEMMLTVLTVVIGLFAYLGIVNLTSIKNEHDEMKRNLRGNRELLDKMRLEIDKNIEDLKHPSHFKTSLDYLIEYGIGFLQLGKTSSFEDCLYMGLFHYSNNNYKDAVSFLEEALRQEPNNEYSLFYKALALDDLQNYQLANDAYNEVVAKAKNITLRWLSHSNKAFTLIEIARDNNRDSVKYNEAINEFNKAISIDPSLGNDPIINNGLALCYYEKGDKKTALQKYETAKLHISDSYKHEMLYSKKQYERMIEAINKYFRLA